MAKLGVEHPATESVAQPARVETPFAETERRAGGAPATAPVARPTSGVGYRRVFACAIASSDSPDEERPS